MALSGSYIIIHTFSKYFQQGVSEECEIMLPPGVSGKVSLFWFGDGQCYNAGLRWTGLKSYKLAQGKPITLKVFIPSSGFTASNPIATVSGDAQTFDKEQGELKFGNFNLRNYPGHTITIQLEIAMDFPATKVEKKVETNYTDIHSSQFPNDVRLVFPHSLELWTTVKTLSALSSYFKDLLASSFAEAKPRGKESYAERTNEANRVVVDKDFEDSDDESDELTVSARGGEAVKDGAPRAPFRQIDIDAVAYTTYRAFLCWLQTSRIEFAPLASSHRLADDPVKARNAAIDKMVAKNPSLPRPASPKSIYRLAHFLDIPDLMQLALRSIKIQLTVENIAFEVYGDLAGTFKEVREVEVDYAVSHWQEAKKTAAMVEVQREIEEGSMHLYPVVSFALSGRL